MSDLQPICCCDEDATPDCRIYYPDSSTIWGNSFDIPIGEMSDASGNSLIDFIGDGVVNHNNPPATARTFPGDLLPPEYFRLGGGQAVNLDTDQGMELTSFSYYYYYDLSASIAGIEPNLFRWWDQSSTYDQDDVDITWEIKGILHEPYTPAIVGTSPEKIPLLSLSGKTYALASVGSAFHIAFFFEMNFTKPSDGERKIEVFALQAGEGGATATSIYSTTHQSVIDHITLRARLLQSGDGDWEVRFFYFLGEGNPAQPVHTLHPGDLTVVTPAPYGDRVSVEPCQNLWDTRVSISATYPWQHTPTETIPATITGAKGWAI